MPYNYGELYPSSSLPRELVDVPSGEVRYYEGTPYRVLNESGGRRLERPSFSETGVSSADRLQSPEGQLELAQKIQQQQLQFRKTANAPIAASMKAGIPTLQSRYKQILDDLTFRESEESAKVSQRVSREYGRRGIPLSSDIYARSSEEELRPTSRFYAGERTNVGITEQEQLDQIRNAISVLESGSPSESIPQGIGLFGNVSSLLESSENRRVQQDQFNRELAQAMKISEMQYAQKPEKQKLLSFAGKGGYVYDPSTGQVVKVGGGGGGGEEFNVEDAFINWMNAVEEEKNLM